jgi:hypothetical protein
MKAFNLKTFLTANKGEVLNQFEALKKEEFYNNITLRGFMIEVMNHMSANNPKSEKKAESIFLSIISHTYLNNSILGDTIYSTPKNESNLAKQEKFYGKEKTRQLNNI